MAGGLVLVWVIAMGLATSRAGYETASYTVEEAAGSFEIRNYRSHQLVATPIRPEGRDGSFGRLFRYISGGNEAESKIEMTTPVFMPATEDGAMKEMQFVLPADVAKNGAPAPRDAAVTVRAMRGGKFAVLRFRGRLSDGLAREKLAELRRELEERGLEAAAPPVFAGYDPPWTPGALRRNEVLLRLAE